MPTWMATVKVTGQRVLVRMGDIGALSHCWGMSPCPTGRRADLRRGRATAVTSSCGSHPWLEGPAQKYSGDRASCGLQGSPWVWVLGLWAE